MLVLIAEILKNDDSRESVPVRVIGNQHIVLISQATEIALELAAYGVLDYVLEMVFGGLDERREFTEIHFLICWCPVLNLHFSHPF